MRYLAYARFSPRRDADKCPSCERQLDDLRGWVESDSEFVEFKDPDKSGKTMNRDGLQTALKSLRKGDVLIVRDWDRLARDLEVQLKIARFVDDKGAELCAMYGGNWCDVNDPMVEMVSKILAVIAEGQRKIISKRTSERMKQHQTEGRCMGSKPPFGSKIKLVGDEKRLIKIPDEQETIKRILELRNDRQFNWTQIAQTLGNEGRKISRSKNWAPNVVRRIYKRETVSFK
jgi:site-specific DNA recombinase